MPKLTDYTFPDDLKYIFIEPNSLYWVKESIDKSTGEKIVYIGFPDLITKNFDTKKVKLAFRSENLLLREKKPFLRLLTSNKLFEFEAPWKSGWNINPELVNNNYSFIDEPYEHFIIKCYNIVKPSGIDSVLRTISELGGALERLVQKDVFGNCSDCPDLTQGFITRRNNGKKSERN